MLYQLTVEKIELASQRYSSQINGWVDTQVANLNYIKQDIEINREYFTDENIEVMLSQKLERSGGLALDYYIGKPDRTLLSGTGWEPDEGYDCTKRDWYTFAEQSNRVVITSPYVDSDSKQMVVTISVPIIKDNVIYGVLAEDITIDSLVKLVNQIEVSKGSYSFLLDQNFKLITHPNRSYLPNEKTSYGLNEILDGRFQKIVQKADIDQYNTMKVLDYDGSNKFFYLSKIETPDWYIGFSIPTTEITDKLRGLLIGFAAACAVSLAASMMITFLLLIGLLRPVFHLTRVVKQFGDKNMDVRCDVSTSDEIGELGLAFNAMAEVIQMDSKTLEHKVMERTRELNEKNKKIQDSIEYAKKIQQTILPEAGEISKTLKDYFVIWKPRDIVGGDLYWMKRFQDGFTIILGDCTGHGIPGALMTMAVNSMLDRIVDDVCHNDPAKILDELDLLLYSTLKKGGEDSEIQDGMDAGIVYISDSGQIIYAGAHISFFVLKNESITEIKGISYTVGTNPEVRKKRFENKVIQIEEGMSFYMATDGMKDQIGGEKRLPYGKKGMLAVLKTIQQYPMEEQKHIIWSSYEAYKQDEIPRDDVTMLGFRL